MSNIDFVMGVYGGNGTGKRNDNVVFGVREVFLRRETRLLELMEKGKKGG